MVAAADDEALDAHVVAVALDVVPGLGRRLDDLLGHELRAAADRHEVVHPRSLQLWLSKHRRALGTAAAAGISAAAAAVRFRSG